MSAVIIEVVCPSCGKTYATSGGHECPFCCHIWDDGEPYCWAHGDAVVMKPRDLKHQTPEQKTCGLWYDCPKCGNSTLFPSAILKQQANEQAAKAVKGIFNQLAAPFGVSI